ncbi:MAG: polysaccharide export protein [Pyrinomonadaceae bacterium]|nr:polysaccharide export protein [Pyrinomonadaceae bacterium]
MMKNLTTVAVTIALTAVYAWSPCGALSASAQSQRPAGQDGTTTPTKPRTSGAPGGLIRPATPNSDRLEPDDTRVVPAGVSEEVLANRRDAMSEEEAAVLPYYNNFMSTYRLGPEDVISVQVFDKEKYSRSGITVPPDGKISYPLIKGGVHVAGKTTQQVAEEITKQLDEYIIDPKVSVYLERVMSARFSIIGDVAQPGVRLLTRRMTVYEALSESGGVLPTGDKKKVRLLRRQVDGTLLPIEVNIAAIEKGKAIDGQFLAPGDQILVPGNKFKTFQKVLSLVQVLSFARIFAGGGF